MANTFADTYSKMRWYIERNRLAVVQVNDSANIVDDLYNNIPLGSELRIYGGKIAEHFSASNNSLDEIPEQFHEAIVYKAIATGYETPPNLDPNLASYFKGEYNQLIKKAKKWKKMGRTGGYATISPRDY